MTHHDPNGARFEALYAAHRRDLLAYFLRRAEPVQAADLLAATFLVAWRRLDVVPVGPAARLWLFGVARHQLANHRRASHSARQVAVMLAESLLARTQFLPDATTGLAVRAALDWLNPADRETIMLPVYEELTPTEIAEVAGRTAVAVRARLHRARRRIARSSGRNPPPAPSCSHKPSAPLLRAWPRPLRCRPRGAAPQPNPRARALAVLGRRAGGPLRPSR